MRRKPSQVGTFASHLQHFARSVDIVDPGTMEGVRDLIYEYLQDEFDAEYLDLSIQYLTDGAPGLRTHWSSSNRDFSSRIRNDEGAYGSQVALCFDSKKPLWIVGSDQLALGVTAACVDLWSNVTDLPAYKAPIEDRPLFTSVLIPVRRPYNRILGVMVVEASTYQDIADFDRQELVALADAWGVLHDLRDFNDIQTRGTRDAVDQLRRLKNSAGFPQIGRAQVFVAHSDRADDHVLSAINRAIGRLEGPPLVFRWRDHQERGRITEQIDTMIHNARVGVCYLSEPTGNNSFQDNANVLIELGMFHEREVAQAQSISLLVREKDSPPLPFDISDQRMLIVPRHSNGSLDNETFLANLDDALRSLMR
jgi:hypothetical protein